MTFFDYLAGHFWQALALLVTTGMLIVIIGVVAVLVISAARGEEPSFRVDVRNRRRIPRDWEND